jgi:virginiamycin B lyase
VGIVDHPDLAPGSPQGIVSGPDDALWFAEYNGNQIRRITTAGAITTFTLLTANSGPNGITAGPDGALWFTEELGNNIGRITTSGAITEFPVPTAKSRPEFIALGPDGALWFTEYDANKIGRITTAGEITEFPLPETNTGPQGITAGPDGALWFTEGSIWIGRITTDGAITEFPAQGISDPLEITAGPDGALWFTEGSAIGRITTAGAATEFQVPPFGYNAYPTGITAGPDGALWFTGYWGVDPVALPMIGRITTSGAITEYDSNTEIGQGITTGPDGALWFTAGNGGAGDIGQVVSQTASLTPTPATVVAGSGIRLSGAGFFPGESVQLFLNSTSANLFETAAAGADGSFVLTSRIGGMPYGPQSVVAVGQSSGRLAVAQIFVTAVMTLNPSSGSAGSSVTISGTGFPSLEDTQIWWSNSVELGVVEPDQSGRFTHTFTVPADAVPGPNVIQAKGPPPGFNQVLATATFTVQ